jgi:hypothetical protein
MTTDDVRARATCCGRSTTAHRRQGRSGLHRGRPPLAHDTAATIAQAKALYAAVGPPQRLIKIPATPRGSAGDQRRARRGNQRQRHADLRLERYRAVMHAFLEGLERPVMPGTRPRPIHSVASFFVSRVDTEIDKQLDRDRHPRGPGCCAARPAWPTPDWPTRPSRRSSRPRGGRAWPTTAPGRSARCGRPRESRTRPTRHDVCHRAGRSLAPSTPCRRRRSARSPTTGSSPATRSPTYAQRPVRARPTRPNKASRIRGRRHPGARGRRKFERRGVDLLADVQAPSTAGLESAS